MTMTMTITVLSQKEGEVVRARRVPFVSDHSESEHSESELDFFEYYSYSPARAHIREQDDRILKIPQKANSFCAYEYYY